MYYSFPSLTADFYHTANSLLAPSLRELCALEFCGLNRDLGKASHTPEAKAQLYIFIPSHQTGCTTHCNSLLSRVLLWDYMLQRVELWFGL